MNTRLNALKGLLLLLVLPLAALAQTPVDDRGNVIGRYEASPAEIEPVVGNDDIPLLSKTELEDLVGPIALYPDDLLAIVLPASAYPLQIVDAARFLEALEDDPSLKPDPEWDDSVVALLNYPEIIEHLNEDIDWTWRLGEAVVAQQNDVVGAIERFRDRAYAAGNLKSDSYQNVTRNDGVVEITPVSDDVIYVPYYEPERVVVYQPRPVYYYYPRAYPVYYYPYSAGYHFDRGYFWGVTTAFTIGWLSDSLHVYHHSYHGHPYYGWTYWDRWWYRRPTINVYNTHYVRNPRITINRYYEGDRWRPRIDRRIYSDRERVTRNRFHPSRDSRRQPAASIRTRSSTTRREEPIRFRQRDGEPRDPGQQVRNSRRSGNVVDRNADTDRSINRERRQPATRDTRRQRPEIRFRERPETDGPATARRQERREPATVRREDRRQPAVNRRQERREAATLRREDRRQPTVNRRQERREPATVRREDRRQPAVNRRQERREPVARTRPEPRSPAARPSSNRQVASRPSQPQREARSQQRAPSAETSGKQRRPDSRDRKERARRR